MRQKRFPSKKIILGCASEITNKKVNIVMRDGQVLLAIILNLSPDELTIQNMRLAQTKIDLNSISEIILDIKD